MRIISGEMYFYYEAAYKGLPMQIFLDEAVDEKILKKALEKTKDVHPYLAWTASEKDGDIFLEDTGDDIALVCGEVFPILGGENLGGKLAAVVYYENCISLHFYHGLIDGVASKRALETTLYFYYCIKDNKEYDADKVMKLKSDCFPTMFEEPFKKKISVDEELIQKVKKEKQDAPKKLFSLVGKKENCGSEDVIQTVIIPSVSLLKFSKDNKTSPSVAIAMLSCLAIMKLYPKAQDMIRVNIPISLRDALGVSDTFKNTTADATLYFDPLWLETDTLTQIGERLRKDLKEILQPDRLRLMADDAMDFLDMAANKKSFCERKAFYESITPPIADTILVSYMGKVNGGSYTEHITMAQMITIPRDGMVINVLDGGQNFAITILKHGTDQSFADAFLSVCHNNNMGAELKINKVYKLSDVVIKSTLGLE